MADPVLFEILIPSQMSAGMAVQDRVIGLMQDLQFSGRDIFAMRLSLEEAISNAIRHGNRFAPDKQVWIRCELTELLVRVVVRDEGEGFDPEQVPDPTLAENLERPSGRGLLLMRAYLSECCYSDSGRCLTLVRERNSPLPIVPD
ncbi:hypothetical protein LBMAG46_01760 [Planctomycetia bacterium]|nr:hypothetical protein LBMAG46_01760 [Planctomycetia bacterium]